MIVDVFCKWPRLMGGGERVTATVVEALLQAGHQVVLHTTEQISLETYNAIFGKDISDAKLKVRSCPLKAPEQMRVIGRYVNLACEFAVRAPMRGDIFVDMNPGSTFGATYIRLPDIAYWNPPIDFRKYLSQVLDGPIRRMAFTPYAFLLNKLLDRMNKIPINFVCSGYTERVTRKFYSGRFHARTDVLYPPVKIKDWEAPADFGRKGVISVARFSPWKRHDIQLKIVDKDIPLTMVGGVRAMEEIETVTSLREMKPQNVNILTNQPILKLRELLWKSKVFLHTAHNEPSSTSVVEGIAAGCVPVVIRSGGNSEIVPFRELTFETAQQARQIVKHALSGEFDNYLPRLQEHIKQSDESVFRSRFLAAVEQIGS